MPLPEIPVPATHEASDTPLSLPPIPATDTTFSEPIPGSASDPFKDRSAQVTAPEQDTFEQKYEQQPPHVQKSIDRLFQLINDDDISEITLNGPSEVLCRSRGQRSQITNIDFGDTETYHYALNNFLLEFTDTPDRIGTSSHMVEGQLELPATDENPLPQLARVYIITPPSVNCAKVTLAKKARIPITLDQMVQRGSLTYEMADFLKTAARGRLTCVLSGLSGAGKTTFLQALTHYFDPDERVIVIEDTPELRIAAADVVYMTAPSQKPGTDPHSIVTMEWLVKATNRMRPDRIIVGETRGAEMGDFLIAANSGADGSMTTLHASSPVGALEKMVLLSNMKASAPSETTTRKQIAETVHIVIQLKLIDHNYIVSDIYEVANVLNNNGQTFSGQILYTYDTLKNKHVLKNRPTEQLKNYLAYHGVPLNS